MKSFLTFALLIVSMTGYSQDQEKLLIKAWKLKSHTMTGIGIHHSLPNEMQIEFLNDGTWKSSASWEGTTQGKWSLKNNNRTLSISFNPEVLKDFRISELSDTHFQIENTTLTAVYKLTWTALK
ncbi:MAG: hypothetical protein OJF59_000753 [Cytophagales bacterium]|jgi:hypothetical protein|nr:hypothetical protein [Bacteroidota bacterium]MBS1979745.1 hypothetical protein [Bacteroidota bacterium]WHZ07000.1 MAG: hypothetical protein OJF59_000753 [Cytophagales bacterium]